MTKSSTSFSRIRRLWLAGGLVIAAGLAVGSVFLAHSPKPPVGGPMVRGTWINSLLETNPAPGTAPPLVDVVSTGMTAAFPVARPRTVTVVPGGPRAVSLTRVDVPAFAGETNDGYRVIGFDKLAVFPVKVIQQITDPVRFTTVQKLNRPIPNLIKRLDNCDIAVSGFMLPIELEGGRARRFLLMRSRSWCCFGKPLEINEWISVRMADEPVISIMDQPMTVFGTLHVGEIRENERIVCIYRMDGKKVERIMAFR